jgi:hypothetical protein
MDTIIVVRPATPDLKVPSDNGNIIEYKEEGINIKRTAYIGRRLKDGSLIEIKKKINIKPKEIKGGN